MWCALEKLGVPDCTINIIRSFHEGMCAKVHTGGESVQEIPVKNDLRQGCTIAPVLFNLYARLIAERWSARVKDDEGMGTYLRYKLDHQPFRQSTRNAEECHLNECQFADNAALLATTRAGAEQALASYVAVAATYGLRVSLPKTELLVVGHDVKEEDKASIHLKHGSIDYMDEFCYLSSLVASSGRIDTKVDRRITNTSKAFGALRRAVFIDRTLPPTPSDKCIRHTSCLSCSMDLGVGHHSANISSNLMPFIITAFVPSRVLPPNSSGRCE